MNAKLRQKAKTNFEKDFFGWWIITEKWKGNMRTHRDIKLVTTKSRRHYLVSEQNYHTAKFFTENVLVIEMRKILMNKPVCLGLSILDLGKTVIHEFWYDYAKPKFGGNTELCHMDTDSFIVYVKTEDICKDIA